MKGGTSMKKQKVLLAMFLAAVLAYAMPCQADDNQTEYECCCALTCEWEYSILNPVCLGKDNSTGTVYALYAGCRDWPAEGAKACVTMYADIVCKQETEQDAIEQVKQDFSTICPEAGLGPMITVQYVSPTPVPCEFGVKDDCSIIDLTGPEDSRLEIVRLFRDDVLAASPAGRQLINLYYNKSGELINIFQEHPAIKARAKALLDKAIPAVASFLAGNSTAGLLNGEIAAEADALINDIEAVRPGFLKESLSKLRENIKNEGVLQ